MKALILLFVFPAFSACGVIEGLRQTRPGGTVSPKRAPQVEPLPSGASQTPPAWFGTVNEALVEEEWNRQHPKR